MSYKITVEFDGLEDAESGLRSDLTVETEVASVEGIRPTYEMIISNFTGEQ